MTALAEALLAAQRQAIGALSKAYVADAFDPDLAPATFFIETLNTLGCTDVVEQGQMLAALDVLRTFGAPAPKNGAEPQGPKPQSPGQRKYVADLFRKANIEPLPDADLDALNFDRTSDLIDSLKAGTYDPDKWTAPF